MLTIIYARDCNKAEVYAQQHRSPEKTIFVRDVKEFVAKDVEPCDEVLLFDESAEVRKAYRAEKIKLFNEVENKQGNSDPDQTQSGLSNDKADPTSDVFQWPKFDTRVGAYFADQLRKADAKFYLDKLGVEYKKSASLKQLVEQLHAS